MAETVRDPGTDAARLAPWCPAILEASLACDVDPYILAAICLRETEAGWSPLYSKKGCADGWGDRDKNGVRHGFGLVQVDDRWHAMFVRSPDAANPRAQFMYAAEMLAEAKQHFERHFPDAPASLITDAVLASYNAGVGRIDVALRTGRRPDECTAHGNYSSDVQRRAADLKREHPHLFTPQPRSIA